MSTATDMRDKYITAEAAILGGQSYRWGDRQLTRADLAQVQSGRREWERKAASEARGGDTVGIRLANLSGMPMAPEGGEGCYRWRG
ncbi:MAG: hypothetical protein WA777_01785 [Rhodanobacter sp.]